MEAGAQGMHVTVPPASAPTLIVVVGEPGARQAIQRTMPGCRFAFAKTEEEAAELARAVRRSGFFVF